MDEKQKLITKFGQRVREIRLELGLSQEELAGKSGVHRTYVGMIERGEKNITIGNMEKLFRALSITMSKFFKDFD